MFDFLKKLFASASDSPTEQNGPQLSEQSGGAGEVKRTKEESTRARMQRPPKRV